MAVNPHLPAVLTDPPHWTVRAACRGMSGPHGDPWFPDAKGAEGRRITAEAKAVCRLVSGREGVRHPGVHHGRGMGHMGWPHNPGAPQTRQEHPPEVGVNGHTPTRDGDRWRVCCSCGWAGPVSTTCQAESKGMRVDALTPEVVQ